MHPGQCAGRAPTALKTCPKTNRQTDDRIPHGPVRALTLALRDGDWHLSSPAEITTDPSGETLPLLHQDSGMMEHKFREALRLKQLRALARRRPDFAGVENGVDRSVTMRPISKAKGFWKTRYRNMLAGAVTTRVREHRRKRCATPFCPCCDLWNPETESHALWDSPSAFYGLIRETLRCPSAPCTRSASVLAVARHCAKRAWDGET